MKENGTSERMLIRKNAPKDELIPSPAKDMGLIQEKHQRIVEGACRLFFEKGYHKTTIREIASSAGMSMGQLYHYISSKDDVLFLIYKHMQVIWYENLVQSGIEEIQDPIKRLKQALRQTISFMLKNRDLFLFVYTETKYLEKKHLKVVLEMDDKNVVGFFRRLLREADIEKQIPGDCDLLANLISYLLMFIPLRGWNLRDKPLQDYTAPIVDFILRGIGIES